MPQPVRKATNLLITGGAGFIGSAFIRYLLKKRPHFEGKVVNLDLLTYAGNRENLSEIQNDPRHVFVQGDIRHGPLVEHLCEEYEIDTILHCAAETHVDRSIASAEEFLQTNILGTFQLLEVVRQRPEIHLHHVSTDEVYGALGPEGIFTEESPFQPNSPYSASKAAADHLIRAYGKTHGVSFCISHASNNYGPGQYPEKLIPLALSRALQGLPIPIYGRGEQIRDWLYVFDHAEALWILLQAGRSGESYNVGGGIEKNNLALVQELLNLLALRTGATYRSLITFVPDRPGHDFRYALSAEKMRREFDWTPRTPFSQGLLQSIDWYLQNSERLGVSNLQITP